MKKKISNFTGSDKIVSRVKCSDNQSKDFNIIGLFFVLVILHLKRKNKAFITQILSGELLYFIKIPKLRTIELIISDFNCEPFYFIISQIITLFSFYSNRIS